MPKSNKKDLEDIPKYVLDDLKFVYVDHMDQVFKVALGQPLKVKEEIEEPKGIHPPMMARLPS